jgi:hypothetical protein
MIQTNTKQANLSVSSSTEMGTSDYQPGGACNCIKGRWTGRIKESVTDPSGLGRWAGHILYGKKDNNIVIITAYRPVKDSGFQTSYQQQWQILRHRNTANPDVRI